MAEKTYSVEDAVGEGGQASGVGEGVQASLGESSSASGGSGSESSNAL
jgi:hypothetical protein